jgi:CheY-like chemotaxis protein
VPRVRLIHWKQGEVGERSALLRAAGYEVEDRPLAPSFLRELGEAGTDAVVIDLARIPSHGRDAAISIRARRSTRHIPIVFVGGDPAKVERIRAQLPDATYTSWKRIRSSLAGAIASPVADPVVPASSLSGYEGTPLPAKLGVKPGTTLLLSGAPAGFEKVLGRLPRGASTRRRGRADLAVWFVRSARDLEGRIARMGSAAPRVWIAWPKKASGVASDLTQSVVRRAGLASGLVDYKVCSIDDTWSGLLFTRRGR